MRRHPTSFSEFLTASLTCCDPRTCLPPPSFPCVTHQSEVASNYGGVGCCCCSPSRDLSSAFFSETICFLSDAWSCYSDSSSRSGRRWRLSLPPSLVLVWVESLNLLWNFGSNAFWGSEKWFCSLACHVLVQSTVARLRCDLTKWEIYWEEFELVYILISSGGVLMQNTMDSRRWTFGRTHWVLLNGKRDM